MHEGQPMPRKCRGAMEVAACQWQGTCHLPPGHAGGVESTLSVDSTVTVDAEGLFAPLFKGFSPPPLSCSPRFSRSASFDQSM